MANRDINQDVDQLKQDLNGLRADVSSLVDAMREAGTQREHAAYERAREYSDRARTRVREGVDGARETLGKEVEERPVTSMLTAFGAGFVVGMLLDRRH